MILSVIIPTCNRVNLLTQCLDKLIPGIQTLTFEEYEVIVSDDSKDLNTKYKVEANYPWVRWYAGPRKGPAANRNNGAKYATGDWLVFLDDDCLPDKYLLETYKIAKFNFPEVSVFEGMIYVDRPQMRFDEVSPINLSGGHLWSCNFAIKSDVFFKINGFDEDFPFAAMEDVDIHYRLKKNKFPIQFLKSASVCHPWRPINGLSGKIKKEQSILIYLNKHPEEVIRINSVQQLKVVFNSILKIAKYLFRFRGRGVFNYMISEFYHVIISLKLFINKI